MAENRNFLFGVDTQEGPEQHQLEVHRDTPPRPSLLLLRVLVTLFRAVPRNRPIGIGNTWLARAFGQKACRDGFTALFAKANQLFRDLAMARADGRLGKLLFRLSRIEVLIVDDWAMAPLAEAEWRDFLEICDERYQNRSTLLTSQLPVSAWHAQVGDPTVADSILDRLVHHAHRIELQGESMRKKRAAGKGSSCAEDPA